MVIFVAEQKCDDNTTMMLWNRISRGSNIVVQLWSVICSQHWSTHRRLKK